MAYGAHGKLVKTNIFITAIWLNLWHFAGYSVPQQSQLVCEWYN